MREYRQGIKTANDQEIHHLESLSIALSICYRKSNDGFLEQVPTAWVSNLNAQREKAGKGNEGSRLGGDCYDMRNVGPF
jgi:hypothetical protein